MFYALESSGMSYDAGQIYAIIPCVMEGYRYERVFCLFVCLRTLLCRLFFENYLSNHFQILFVDSVDIEDLQRCSFD